MLVAAADEASFLRAFHAGNRDVLATCYREQYARVSSAVGAVVQGPDRETVVHEVFLRLLSDEPFRRSFQGGDLGSWLAVVAKNRAIDHRRRAAREIATDALPDRVAVEPADLEAEARMAVDRFRAERLPPKWRGVFETRFVRQLPQREAARELGIQRTTLVYQEARVRALLRSFLLEEIET
jgi:RNA polymerase sigma-70 factor (ECF subfamily)